MRISFTINPTQLASLEAAFRTMPRKAATAAMYALNRAADSGKTIAIRALVANLGIKKSALTTPHRWGESGEPTVPVRVIRATRQNLTAQITIQSGRIPLIYFNPRFSRLTKKARVYTGQGWKTLKHGTGVSWTMGKLGGRSERMAFKGSGRRGTAESADVAASGHVGVFKRKPGVPRLPIQQLYGPSVGDVARKDADLRKALDVDLTAALEKRLDYELGRIVAEVR